MTLPRWLPLALLGALVAALWYGLSQRARVKEIARIVEQEREVAALVKAGIQLAREVTERDLRGQLELTQRRLAAMGIRSTPVAAVRGTTGPVGAAAPSGRAPPTAPEVPPASGPGAACLFAAGDVGEIRVSGGAVRTEAGNIVVDGRADAYALDPERHLFGGALRLDVAIPKPSQETRGSRWGSGLVVAAGRDGWSVGPALASPPFSVLGLRFEPSAAFTLGSQGQWSAVGAVIVRGSP